MNAAVRRDIRRISAQLDEFEGLAALAEERVERISGWSVGQHLDHLMKSDRTIFGYFPAPDDAPLPPLTTAGRIILWSGWIPRGKGKAPKATQPESPTIEALLAELHEIRALFAVAIERPEPLAESRAIARHPYFGGLNRAQWLRFVAVHHHHHAKIVRDVLRADPA